MSEARLITATWPVVVIVGPVLWETGWVEDVDRQLQGVFDRREPFAVVTDTRPIENVPGAKERKILTDWLKRADLVANQKRWNVGSATIIENPITRGSLQALYWLWTPPTPQYVARDLDDAWAWCTDALAARGVPLPLPAPQLRAIASKEMQSPLSRNTPR